MLVVVIVLGPLTALVALLVRDGLLDAPGGAQELDITESQLHELVVKLRTHAGQEEI